MSADSCTVMSFPLADLSGWLGVSEADGSGYTLHTLIDWPRTLGSVAKPEATG
jgi:hypothetical protein